MRSLPSTAAAARSRIRRRQTGSCGMPGIKVGFHMMPNLPHSTIAKDKEMFETIFSDPRFKPDFLKIYPTLVTPGSEIEELWELKKYAPYEEDELIDLIAYAKSLIPEYTRPLPGASAISRQS